MDYKCPRCNTSFIRKDYYQKHLNRKNHCQPEYDNTSTDDLLKDLLKNSCNKPYACKYCDATFSYASGKSRHVKVCKHIPNKAIKSQKVEKKEYTYRIQERDQSQNVEKAGYMYLIQEREFIKSGESVFKIGRTNNIKQRFSQYPKGSDLCFSVSTTNINEVEYDLINIFKGLFTHRQDIGSEYFEGNREFMIECIQEYVNYMKDDGNMG